jgi:hypothetical protein
MIDKWLCGKEKQKPDCHGRGTNASIDQNHLKEVIHDENIF